EKDRNIATINNRLQKILTFSLLFGSVIVLLGAYLTIRNYQSRFNANQIIHKQNEEINQRRITELENNLKIETMQSMILGQEAERERIAKDLHDSLGGLLSTVKLHFDAVQTHSPGIDETSEYQQAHALLDEACKEVRNISNNMQPGALLRLGVVSAIGDLINRLQSDSTAQIEFQHYGLNGSLDQTISLNIFRIVQELLTNSLKHAQASQILVQLIQKDDELMVMVEDDGIGYDSSAVKQGMGTENIASRVNFLKGDLSIHSVIGEGTSTLVNIPLG
ncbi:MAG: sensor histidine kinase, partial [Saprospiraceae bacterium]|nr:sensor histidine kinase [Saprospiraceae bacterium]